MDNHFTVYDIETEPFSEGFKVAKDQKVFVHRLSEDEGKR